MSALSNELKAALNTELATLYPVADYPVENAELALLIDQYADARAAEVQLATRSIDSYSTVGVSMNFRDPQGAARTATAIGIRLARAGFSINAGTPVCHDIRDFREKP